ncbi:hypothetical protein [Methanoculleus sp. 7T]|uniref:hypothetical protein n=1 Tax=Methanoculleus sp. 7T TaxID=2937282 RepID=UPI0020C132C1|nr:hypothetical protein [Methanoculleus sp. 7T]MCK8518417.1 hypothetical protein [Methanoculleus sp. 7T]
MGEIGLGLPGLLLASLLIGMFIIPAVSTAASAPSSAGGKNTNWLDTFDEWVTPRDMSMYNKPIVTEKPVRPGPEDLIKYPGMILLGENVTFPDIAPATVSGIPSGPTAQVAVADPAYFSPVPPTLRANLTNLPPLRNYDLVTADPGAFVAAVGSGSQVALRLRGQDFVLDLDPVPGPVAEGARAFVKNESGTFAVALPRISSFEGAVAGEPGSFASFTVGDDVILGTIRYGTTSLVIAQAGTIGIGGEQRIVHVVYDERDVIPRFRPLATDSCVPPGGAGGSPDVTGNRVASLSKSLIDAMRPGRAR